MAQFSRHIRPGATIIASGDPRVAAACDAARGVLTLVAFNAGGAGVELDVDLSAFAAAAGPAAAWRTIADGSGGDAYARLADVPVAARAFRAQLPAHAVQTFDVAGVVC